MNQNRKKKGNYPNLRFPEFEGEWEEKKLGGVAEIVGGGTPDTTIDEYWNGNIQWFTPSEIKSSYVSESERTITELGVQKSSAKLLPTGTILLTTRATIGETAITKNICTTNQGFQSLIVNKQSNNIFIANWIKQNTKELVKRSNGSTFLEINKSEIEKISISIPSKVEQDKIAIFLTLIDQRIETQRKIIEGYESLIKGISHKLFQDSKAALNKNKLGSLCDIRKGKQINAIDLFQIGEYYVMNGGVDPSGYYNDYNTEADTISISEGGNSCGYIQYNDSRFWSGGHCYTLENIDKQIIKQYLYFYLKSEEEKIMSLRVGSGLPNIQKKDLERFEINYPDTEKQYGIAQFLLSIDTKIQVESSILEKYQSQKMYLLQNLFI